MLRNPGRQLLALRRQRQKVQRNEASFSARLLPTSSAAAAASFPETHKQRRGISQKNLRSDWGKRFMWNQVALWESNEIKRIWLHKVAPSRLLPHKIGCI